MKKSQRRAQNNNSYAIQQNSIQQKKGQSISVSNPGTYRASDLNTQLKPRIKRDTTNLHLMNALNEIDGTKRQIEEQKEQLLLIKANDKINPSNDTKSMKNINLQNIVSSPISPIIESRNTKSHQLKSGNSQGESKKGRYTNNRDIAAFEEYLQAPVRAELMLDDDYEDVNDSILDEKRNSSNMKKENTYQDNGGNTFNKSIDQRANPTSFDNTADGLGKSSRLSLNDMNLQKRVKINEINETLSHLKQTKSSSMKRKEFLSSSKLGLNTSTSYFNEQSAYRSNPKVEITTGEDTESVQQIQINDNNNKYLNKKKMKTNTKNNSPKRKSDTIAPVTTPNKKIVLSLERKDQAQSKIQNPVINKTLSQQFQTTLPNRKSETINSKKPIGSKNKNLSTSKLGFREQQEAKTPCKFKKSIYINSQKKISNIQGLASAKQMLNSSITSVNSSSAAQFAILKTNNYLNSVTPQNSKPIQLQTNFNNNQNEDRVGIHQQSSRQKTGAQESRQMITSPFKSKVQLIMEANNINQFTKSTLGQNNNTNLESSSQRRANKPLIGQKKEESYGGRIFNSKSPSKKSLQLQQILKSINMSAASNPSAQSRKRNTTGATATPQDGAYNFVRNFVNQPQMNANIHSHTKSYQALNQSDEMNKGSSTIYNLMNKPSSHVNPYIQTKNRLVSVGSKLDPRYNFNKEIASQEKQESVKSSQRTTDPIVIASNIKLKIESNISNNYYNKNRNTSNKLKHQGQKSQDMNQPSPTNNNVDFKSHILLTDRSEQITGREKNNGLIETYKRPTQAKKTLETTAIAISATGHDEKKSNHSPKTAFQVEAHSNENIEEREQSVIKTPKRLENMMVTQSNTKMTEQKPPNNIETNHATSLDFENPQFNFKRETKHMEISFQDDKQQQSVNAGFDSAKKPSKLLIDAEQRKSSATKKKKSRVQKSSKKQKQTPESLLQNQESKKFNDNEISTDDINATDQASPLPDPSNLYSEPSPNFGQISSNKLESHTIDQIEPFVADLNQPKMVITKNNFSSLNTVLEKTHESLTTQQSKICEQQNNKYQSNGNDDQYPMTANQFLLLYKDKMLQEEISELGQGSNQFKTIYFPGTITSRHGDDLDILKSVNDERKQQFEEKIKSEEDHSNGEYQGNPMFDNFEGYYRVQIGEHISYRYEIMKILGKGSFAQVVQCRDHKQKDKPILALKITRNTEMDHKFAHKEAQYLNYIMQEDPNDKHNIVRMLDQCYFREHQCFVFELLHTDLFEHLKATGFVGFSTDKIRDYALQILKGLVFLEKHKIIHCDLKPENILCADTMCRNLKIVDFGSGCFRDEQIYTYVQSRFYRSPEVILRIKYCEKVDIWSLGCILAELYTGEPIFPGNNEQEQLELIMELSGMPPESMIDKSRKKDHYFDIDYSPFLIEDEELGILRIPSSRSLNDAIPCEDNLFLDFVQLCLEIDPETRFSASEAMEHPWIKEAIQSQIKKNKMLERSQKQKTNKRMGQNESGEQIYHPQIIRDKDKEFREREGDGAKEIPAEFSPERDILVQRKKQIQKPNKESFGIKLNNLNFSSQSKPKQQVQQVPSNEFKITDFSEEQKLSNSNEQYDQPLSSTSTGKFNPKRSYEVYQTNESASSSFKNAQQNKQDNLVGQDKDKTPLKNNYFNLFKTQGGQSDLKKKSIIPDIDYTNKYVRRQSAIASRNDTSTGQNQSMPDEALKKVVGSVPQQPFNASPFRNKFINMTSEEINQQQNSEYDDSSAPLDEEHSRLNPHRQNSSSGQKNLNNNKFFPSQ